MLYNGEYTNFTECKTYKHARYKPNNGRGKTFIAYKKIRCLPITPRLQRLFMSLKTVKHITWYYSHDEVDEIMVHLFDGKAWKQFNGGASFVFNRTTNHMFWLVYKYI